MSDWLINWTISRVFSFHFYTVGNDGCDGGMMDQAFTYIQQVGIEAEKDYPYTGKDDNCAYMPSKKAAEDTGFVDIASGNETALIAAIATVGPISVAIDSEHDSFQLYSSGVYNEPACSSTRLCSALLAVGYGNFPSRSAITNQTINRKSMDLWSKLKNAKCFYFHRV